jgi:hypothetical protein
MRYREGRLLRDHRTGYSGENGVSTRGKRFCLRSRDTIRSRNKDIRASIDTLLRNNTNISDNALVGANTYSSWNV